MINSHLKFKKRVRGVATLLTTTVLLLVATIIILFAASYSIMQSKITSNQYRNSQAFQAAEAGLEYGIVYLQKNRTTILANPVNGYIPSYTSSSTTNVTLANNSKYSIVYTNPIANNYNLILITSTGTSDDGTATRVVSQQVQYGALLFSTPTAALVSTSSISVAGNGSITNTSGTTTIKSGSSISLSGNAKTYLSSGLSSTPGNIKSDIQQNSSSLTGLTSTSLFAQYFGVPASTFKNQVGTYYSRSTSTNYSSLLSGVSGTSIWIDQTAGTAQISGNITIGTAANPVLLIVNGNFDISGNVTIYGYVFVIGVSSAETDITGNVNITGGITSTDVLNIAGNVNFAYSPSVISAVQNTTSYFAKVPGSWKDF